MNHTYQKDPAIIKHENIVRNFIKEQNGSFIVYSDDPLFPQLVKNMLKTIGLPIEVIISTSEEQIIKDLNTLASKYDKIVLFLEKHIHGQSTSNLLSKISVVFRKKLIVVSISGELNKDQAVQLLEYGAQTVIVKPISMNSLLEKIANIVKPDDTIKKRVAECEKMIEYGHLDKAEHIAKSIFEIKQNSCIGNMLLGDIMLRRGEYNMAESLYVKASKSEQMFLEPLKKLVDLYSRINDLEKKLECLQKLDHLSPLNHSRKIDIGTLHIENGDEEAAKILFDKAVKIVKREASNMVVSTLIDIARKARENGKEGLAKEYIDKAIETKGEYNISFDDVWLYNERGISLRRMKKFSEAIECYKKALSISKDDPNLKYNLGVVYMEDGNMMEAFNLFNDAIKTNHSILEESPVVALNFAIVFTKAGKYDIAEECIKKALQKEPEHALANKMLFNLQRMRSLKGK